MIVCKNYYFCKQEKILLAGKNKLFSVNRRKIDYFLITRFFLLFAVNRKKIHYFLQKRRFDWCRIVFSFETNKKALNVNFIAAKFVFRPILLADSSNGRFRLKRILLSVSFQYQVSVSFQYQVSVSFQYQV